MDSYAHEKGVHLDGGCLLVICRDGNEASCQGISCNCQRSLKRTGLGIRGQIVVRQPLW